MARNAGWGGPLRACKGRLSVNPDGLSFSVSRQLLPWQRSRGSPHRLAPLPLPPASQIAMDWNLETAIAFKAVSYLDRYLMQRTVSQLAR